MRFVKFVLAMLALGLVVSESEARGGRLFGGRRQQSCNTCSTPVATCAPSYASNCATGSCGSVVYPSGVTCVGGSCGPAVVNPPAPPATPGERLPAPMPSAPSAPPAPAR